MQQEAIPQTGPGAARHSPKASIINVFLGAGRPLTAVSSDEIMLRFNEKGVVLFRGFAGGLSEFMELTTIICERFLEHVSGTLRPQTVGDNTVTKVLVGTQAVSLHAEMNYSPMRPDALWFRCAEPARAGGETMVADSRQVLAALPDRTRETFETRRIRYRSCVGPSTWRHITKQQTRDQALALIALLPNCHGEPRGDDELQFDFLTEAIRPTSYHAEPGFLNSIANVIEYADQPIRVTFEDGEPIGPELLADIERAAKLAEEPISWEPGDVALIDNLRVMHGRRAFEGERRNIDVRFGLLKAGLR
jgi:alpha-ketoglutarate-dependent taurine dioxygenase